MHLADYIKSRLPYWPNWFNLILLKLNVFGSLIYGRTYKKLLLSDGISNADDKVLDIVNYAIKNIPYYRNKYGDITIKSIQEFRDTIEIIDKDTVIENWNDFLPDNIDWSKVKTGTTGGTSGKSLNLVEPTNRYIYSLAYLHKHWMKFGWHYETRGVFRNHRIENGRDYIISPLLKEIIFDPFRMDDEYAKKCWKTLKRYKVKFIHAYPSAFYEFCKSCNKQGLDLGFINTAFLASEGVTNIQKALFDSLCITIATFYGHSEKLIFAGNTPKSYDLVIEDKYGYCELIDENGKGITQVNELGEMVGTTFFNRYFPLIRYRTGDYASFSSIEKRTLGTIIGRREKNLIYKSNGSTIAITALITHGEVLLHMDGMQYVQNEIGKLTILIVKNEKFTDQDEAFMYEFHQNAMGNKDSVEIKYVDKLIFQKNGKFLSLISNINN